MISKKENIVKLNNRLLINTGTNRACYQSPNASDECIKVNISGNNKETLNEIKYYNLLVKKETCFDMISRFMGEIETSMGNGYVFELIKDYDGSVSKEIDKYIYKGEVEDIIKILDNLFLLKKYLIKEKIYVKDLNTVNIVYQKITPIESRLVIIDGLSHTNYNPLFYRVEYFINKKIKDTWSKFFNSIYKSEIIQNNRNLKKRLDELNRINYEK